MSSDWDVLAPKVTLEERVIEELADGNIKFFFDNQDKVDWKLLSERTMKILDPESPNYITIVKHEKFKVDLDLVYSENLWCFVMIAKDFPLRMTPDIISRRLGPYKLYFIKYKTYEILNYYFPKNKIYWLKLYKYLTLVGDGTRKDSFYNSRDEINLEEERDFCRSILPTLIVDDNRRYLKRLSEIIRDYTNNVGNYNSLEEYFLNNY